MKFALVIASLFVVSASAQAASVTLLSTSQTPFKTCLLNQIASDVHAESVKYVKSEVVTAYPAYAETTVVATFAGPPRETETYLVLLKTDDQMGWSYIQSGVEIGIAAASVNPAPVVRNNIGKDVVTLDLAKCNL